MPDIDFLMQEWPPEVEEMLRTNSSALPTAEFDCDITTYVDVICALVGILFRGGRKKLGSMI
jgi:intraflagellar transport protein 46